jgi:hypothetical protein
MEDILTRLRQDLIGRIGGPISIRLLLQPAQRAVVSASRALERNAESVSDSDCHGCHLSVCRVSLALSRGGDRHSFILAFVPYLLIRGPVNRIARQWKHCASTSPNNL